MPDIKLAMKGIGGDITLSGFHLEEEEGLDTAIVISLFTDRRAEDDDEVPGDPADRRGWWADAFIGAEEDRIGSRLWLLARSKTTPDVVAKAKQYAEEALEWLKEDGIAQDVIVRAGRKKDRLWLKVEVEKPQGGGIENFTFHDIWEERYGLGTSDH